MYRQLGLALIFFATFSLRPAGAAVSSSERAALIETFDQTNGVSWSHSEGWCKNGPCSAQQHIPNDPGTECSWYGITCDLSEQHVIGISLANNNLSGILPKSIANLCALEDFNVRWNALNGELPPLSCASSLQIYLADRNNFSGELPRLSTHTALVVFVVGNNDLSGSIPSLSGLAKLATFDVHGNALTGFIPELSPTNAATGLQSLYIFLADHNALSGPLPDLTGLYTEELDVGHNHLSGQVPAPSQYLFDAGLANLCPNNFVYPSSDPVIEKKWTEIYQYRETVPWGTPWWIECDSIFGASFN